MNKHTITIVIPAYNLPAYTRKTLDSIAEQTYRPLRLILLDDCSPNSLKPLADEYSNLFLTSGIDFAYVRNQINLGVDNGLKVHELLGDGWGMVVHHDDWLTDPKFLSSSMEFLENNPDRDIQLFFANTLTERTKIRSVDSFDENWSIIRGSDFVPYMLTTGISTWASIIFNNSILKEIGWPNNLFYIDSRTGKKLDLDSDDGFSGFYLLAMYGNVCVTGKLVSVRGEPDSSFSKSSSWRTIGNSMFYIYYNLYRYNKFAPYAQEIKQQSLASAYFWGFGRDEKINPKLLQHFDSVHMKAHYFLAYAAAKLRINKAIGCALSLIAIKEWRLAFSTFFQIFIVLLRRNIKKILVLG